MKSYSDIQNVIYYYADAAKRRINRWLSKALLKSLQGRNYLDILYQNNINEDDLVWIDEKQSGITLANPIYPSFQCLPDEITNIIGHFQVKRDFLLIASGIRLIGKHALPVNEKKQILAFALVDEKANLFVHIQPKSMISAIIDKSSSNEDSLEYACSLVNAWSNSYYHFIVEILPRLIILFDYCLIHGIDPWIVIPENPTNWHIRSLELMGIQSDRIIMLGKSIEVRSLLIPSFSKQRLINQFHSIISPRLIKKLQQTLLVNHRRIIFSKKRRILISRRQAQGRAIINEEELFAALKPYGFEVIILEELSFDEQISLFSQANIVIGPHGAGLTNTLFCNPGTNVIELYSTYFNSSFYNLAQILGLNYALFKCKYRFAINNKRANLYVEIKEFIKFCEEFNLFSGI